MFPNFGQQPPCDPCDPCRQGHPMPPRTDDMLLPALLALAILFGGFYFVIKAGVRAGILELLQDPKCPFPIPPDC